MTSLTRKRFNMIYGIAAGSNNHYVQWPAMDWILLLIKEHPYGTLCHTISRIVSLSSLSKALFSPGMVLYVIVVSVYYVNFNHTQSCHQNFIMCMNVFSCLWHQGLTIYVPRTAHNPHPHPHHYHLHFLHFICIYHSHFSIILSVNSSAS